VADSIESYAQDLARAWRSGTTIPLPDNRPASRETAYKIQDRLAELLGEKVTGWKIGSSVKAIQEAEGHDGPIPGRMFASGLFASPAQLPAAQFRRSKVECEFAFRLLRSFSASQQGYATDVIVNGLAFHPAVEIAESRIDIEASKRKRHTYDEIADNGGGIGFVFGPEVPEWRGLDFNSVEIDARIDGGPPITIHSGVYRRDPVEVAVEMVNDIVRRGHDLSTGEYLTTGSLSHPQVISKGQTLKVNFRNLGTVELSLI
jgi:2-keto-4-pentenoate hydratase